MRKDPHVDLININPYVSVHFSEILSIRLQDIEQKRKPYSNQGHTFAKNCQYQYTYKI